MSDEGRERDILHAVPIDYDLDGSSGIRDPRGMYGENLRVRLHMVTAANGGLRTLLSCVSHCDLQVAAPVAAAYASGLACLVADEIDLGATCIDIGGGTTKLAISAAATWSGRRRSPSAAITSPTTSRRASPLPSRAPSA